MFLVRGLLMSAGLVLSIAGGVSAEVRVVTDSTFQREVVESDRPVLVDFTASWCPPCREMAPRIEQLAREHSGVTVVQVDVDESPRLAERFGVTSIPTVIVFYRGARVAVSTGAMSYTRLDQFLHGAIEAASTGASLLSHRWSRITSPGTVAALDRGASYSALMATIGSTVAARRADGMPASSATRNAVAAASE